MNKISIYYLAMTITFLLVATLYFIDDNLIVGGIFTVVCIVNLISLSTTIFKTEGSCVTTNNSIQIKRYRHKNKKDKYYIYLIDDTDDKDVVNFYIQKKGYANLFHVASIDIDDLPDEENYINENISDWIFKCFSKENK